LVYDGERVDARVLDQLETILRHVADELAGWRARALKAEGELKEGNLDSAQQDAEYALAVASEVGNKRAAASAKIVLADIKILRGRPREGESQLEEAAALYKTLGAKAELGETYMRLSKSLSARGDAAGAQKYSDMAYRITRKTSALVER